MRIKHLITVILLVAAVGAMGQRNRHRDIQFKNSAELTELSPEEKSAAAVVLQDTRVFEYKSELSGFNSYAYMLYKTIYKNVRINDEKAVEDFNKVIIPMNGVERILQLSAQSISPSGKITRLDSTHIREIENYAGYGNLKVFAIEGAEVGGEIEYKYTVVKQARTSHVEYFQDEYPVRDAYFEIITPRKFHLNAKGYNGFPELETDTKGRKAWLAHIENIPALAKETYATWEANRMKVVYTIISVQSMVRNDWKTISKGIASRISTQKPADIKKAYKILKTLELTGLSEEEKIQKIEDYVKNNYVLRRSAESSIKSILKTKQGDDMGFTRLMALLLSESQITFELVITSDRYHTRFDTQFPVTTSFEGLLLYFPKYNKYIDPTGLGYRYGNIPYGYTNNQGLFIINEFNFRFDQIQAGDTSSNVLIKKADITIDPNAESSVLDIYQSFTGNRAANSRNVFHYGDEEGQLEYVEFLSSSGFDEFQIEDWDVENEKFSDASGNTPFIFNASLKSKSLAEKAGQDIILNVGKVIGGQTELYQENERIQDFDMRHPVVYHYTISFNIPESYGVAGLDDLVIDEKMYDAEGNVPVAAFQSWYKVTEGKVEVYIHEYYTQTIYPSTSYEEIRKVINSAADFFSKSVLLVKEK